jgi:hypothetical protein
MPGFSGQGRITLFPRLAGGARGRGAWMGNAITARLNASEDVVRRNESFSGARNPLRRISRNRQATLTLVGDEFTRQNMATFFKGLNTAVAAGAAVTNEVLNGGGSGAPAVGEIYTLGGLNGARAVTGVVVRDSTGTPKVLVAGTNYRLNALTGTIEILDVTTGGPYVLPLRADYTPGVHNITSLFNAPNVEVYVLAELINTDPEAAANSALGFELYRVSFNIAEALDMINDEFAEFSITGDVLIDATKPASGALGQLGAMIST